MTMKYGYGRVSTQEQELARQVDLFDRMGIDERYRFMEKMTGTKADRPQLDRLKDEVREGDTVYIESLSRLGRSTKDLLALVEQFQNKGVTLISAKESIDTSTATGKLLTTLMCALAEFERALIVERTQEGLTAARARGRKGGRKPKSEKDIKVALSMYDSKDFSIAEICKRCNVSQGTLYKAVNGRKAQMATV
jgi:DNA invertase Pin-like site-specific DNA recombinase